MNVRIQAREDRVSKMNREKTGDAHDAMRAVLAGPIDGKEWCVCRFVVRTDRSDPSLWPPPKAPPDHGWPLKDLATIADYIGGLGWHATAPVAFFAEADARAVADEYNVRRHGDISYDRAIHVSAIRWTVRLWSLYDGSEASHETGDYQEALVTFSMAANVVKARNTPSVGYLHCSLEGRCDVPTDLLSQGARGELPAATIATCSCGATFTVPEWQALRLVGVWDAGPGEAVVESRHCDRCGSSVSVERKDHAYPV